MVTGVTCLVVFSYSHSGSCVGYRREELCVFRWVTVCLFVIVATYSRYCSLIAGRSHYLEAEIPTYHTSRPSEVKLQQYRCRSVCVFALVSSLKLLGSVCKT